MARKCDSQSVGYQNLQASLCHRCGAPIWYIMHVVKIILIRMITDWHLHCSENDLEIVLPTEPEDVDIDDSSIGNVCFICLFFFVSYFFVLVREVWELNSVNGIYQKVKLCTLWRSVGHCLLMCTAISYIVKSADLMCSLLYWSMTCS